MKRAWLPVLCILIQLVSVSAGPAAPRAAWLAAVASVAGLASGVALLWRDRAPFAVLSAVAVAYVTQVGLDGAIVPASVAVAAQTLAYRSTGGPKSQLRAAALVVAAVAATGVTVVFRGGAFLAAPFGLLILAAAYVGVVRSSRVARAVAERQELVVAERLRIARDLHDVVGHGVGAIAVQAGAARMAISVGALAEATLALSTIESAGRRVLTEVRWLVGLLRDDSERPRLVDLPALISNARRSGLDVTFDVDGELTAADAEVGEAAYRIVQEGLTNVLRHSSVTAATVEMRVGKELAVGITDDGPPAQQVLDLSEGNGVRGIRERVAAVGGTVEIGPAMGGGWAVRARMPIARGSR